MDKLKFKQLDISNINIKKLYGYDFLLNNLSLCIHNKDWDV